ncbi:seminal metalloprotease 1-like [Maniola jurtina]|uniref:seminal metalloprotease 1-like n=1 Tax=Maniola jurtina TaxID=191418 RepID=UPI001E68CA85|nr:seminal metalloprotease 1-like [Maniola jurtina]
MQVLVIILTLGLVMSILSLPLDKIGTKIAILVFKQYLKNKFNGQDSGVGNLLSLRGALPPDVNVEEHSGYFQGDIVLDDAYTDKLVNSMLRNAYIGYDSRWPNNTVPYEFNDKDFDEEQRDAIRDGMKLIANNTCVKFRPRMPKDKVYVNITANATGCYAHVGFFPGLIKGWRVLNYAPYPPGEGCLTIGTIVHELMHILGFQHMHSTYDRDNYVRIIEENIIPGTESFFAILDSDRVSNLGVEYEIQSVLHYSPLAFSRNGNYTIEALEPYEGLMGQREYVTDSDWLRINRHYDCPGAWDETVDETYEKSCGC